MWLGSRLNNTLLDSRLVPRNSQRKRIFSLLRFRGNDSGGVCHYRASGERDVIPAKAGIHKAIE